MKLDRPTIHHTILMFGLSLMVVGLGISLFLLSLGGMIVSANWLAEGQYRKKLHALSKNRSALWLVGLFILHLVWLWNTENFEYALKDIRIKLPLLFLPVVLGSETAITRKDLFRLMWLFSITVLVGIGMAFYHYLAAFNSATDDIREIVFFSSPIRFALLCDLVLVFVFYSALRSYIKWVWAILIFAVIVSFLIGLQSLTGLGMIAAIVAFLAIYRGILYENSWVRIAWIGIPLFLLFATGAFLVEGFVEYRKPKISADNIEPLVEYSQSGERYTHHPENLEVQDGHYIYRYIAFNELEKAWEIRSDVGFEGSDARGQALQFTLIRYMASLGLRKDSAGFAKLTEQDILRIEQGHTSANPPVNPLVRRLEGTYYEINAYINGASGQGSSLVQRLIYLKTGWQVATQNWLLGVGTGDVDDAIQRQYDTDNSQLDSEHRRRSHNQYLSFWIAFGVLGVLYFVALNLRMISISFRQNHFIGVAFSVMAALSFLTEDTLETQVGVSYFAFFYTLFFCLKILDSTGQEFRFDKAWGDSGN